MNGDKRGQQVVSRRGPASQQSSAAASEKEARPRLHTIGSRIKSVPGALGAALSPIPGPPISGPFALPFGPPSQLLPKHSVPAAPRSGNFGFPFPASVQLLQTPHHAKKRHENYDVDEAEDKHRLYRVKVPVNMLCVLGLVFLVVPLLIFFYKEIHIHDDHDEAHYKTEKFINVNTQDIMSEFSHRAHQIQGTRPNATALAAAVTTTSAAPPDLPTKDRPEEESGAGRDDAPPSKSIESKNATRAEISATTKDDESAQESVREISDGARKRKDTTTTTNKDEGEP